MSLRLSSVASGNDPSGASENTLPVESPAGRPMVSRWSFLTNHAHVLVLLAKYPSIVLREVAMRIGITERAVQRIIQELEQEGFIRREKVGRQNRYQVIGDKSLRHPAGTHCTIQELLDLIARRKTAQS
jgi:biotin operon repressor